MTERGNGAEGGSLGDLFTRLADDAQQLAKAEVRLYHALALHKLALSRVAISMLVAALVLALGAVLSLFVMAAIALQPWLGAAGAGLAVALVAFVAAALLARAGLVRLEALLDEKKP